MLLQPGHRQGAGRLGDAAGVLEYILDRRADLVGGDDDHLIHAGLENLERQPPNLADRDPFRKQVQGVEGQAHPAARLERRRQAG